MSRERQPVVELRGLGRAYPGPPVVQALRDVDLVIQHGDYLSIVGPSGSGKSTLLQILGLLDRPTSGTYRLDGADTSAMSNHELAAWRGHRIGFVFQAFHLLAHRSVRENVELAMVYIGVGRKHRQARAERALERVGLGHRVEFTPSTLSGGERQRVAIARAIAAAPSILLADEPTGNLDSDNARSVLDLFDDLHDAGLTLAVVTHDDAVSRRAARRIHTADGRLTEQR